MVHNELTEKYARQITLPEVDVAGQEQPGKARGLIVGMGGLGCPAAQYPAAAGRFYLDVRDPYEEPRPRNSNILSIPLNQLENRYYEIPADRRVYVFCQTGIRSEKAVECLSGNYGFTNQVNVKDGI